MLGQTDTASRTAGPIAATRAEFHSTAEPLNCYRALTTGLRTWSVVTVQPRIQNDRCSNAPNGQDGMQPRLRRRLQHHRDRRKQSHYEDRRRPRSPHHKGLPLPSNQQVPRAAVFTRSTDDSACERRRWFSTGILGNRSESHRGIDAAVSRTIRPGIHHALSLRRLDGDDEAGHRLLLRTVRTSND